MPFRRVSNHKTVDQIKAKKHGTPQNMRSSAKTKMMKNRISANEHIEYGGQELYRKKTWRKKTTTPQTYPCSLIHLKWYTEFAWICVCITAVYLCYYIYTMHVDIYFSIWLHGSACWNWISFNMDFYRNVFEFTSLDEWTTKKKTKTKQILNI